jgi:UDP-2,3-diacylglucosamine hydrolase
LWQWARAAQTQRPVDLYLFGHRHLPLDLEVPGGARYINLGDWITSFTYVELGPDGAALKHGMSSEHSTQQNPHP